jgi:3'(2'), 5'-bisphosphate nucleotidase
MADTLPPQSSSHQAELAAALEAVRTAARVCRSVQAKITPGVMEKDDRSPVTVADFASQAAICRAIGDAFPGDPIIGEEESGALRRLENAPFLERVLAELRDVGFETCGKEACGWIDRGCKKEYAPRFWTLDPIDGTKGFLRKEQYAISLALIIDGQIQLAVLGCPNLSHAGEPDGHAQPKGSIYYALRGQGSWTGPVEGTAAPRPVHASRLADAAQARFCESVEPGHTAQGLSGKVALALGIHREALRMDSQAKYAVVARGEAEIYLRLPAKFGYKEKIWDHAGGVLVVEEAGGIVSDVTGKPLEFNHGYELLANRGVVAANRDLHPRVIATLDEIYSKLPPPQGIPKLPPA